MRIRKQTTVKVAAALVAAGTLGAAAFVLPASADEKNTSGETVVQAENEEVTQDHACDVDFLEESVEFLDGDVAIFDELPEGVDIEELSDEELEEFLNDDLVEGIEAFELDELPEGVEVFEGDWETFELDELPEGVEVLEGSFELPEGVDIEELSDEELEELFNDDLALAEGEMVEFDELPEDIKAEIAEENEKLKVAFDAADIDYDVDTEDGIEFINWDFHNEEASSVAEEVFGVDAFVIESDCFIEGDLAHLETAEAVKDN